MLRIKQTLSRWTKASKPQSSAQNGNGARKSMSSGRPSSNPTPRSSELQVDKSAAPLGPVVLYGEEEDAPDGIDIVFVHDLEGHREDSWTKGDVCWPRDLLGGDIPGVRVISWGWSLRVSSDRVLTHMAKEAPVGDRMLDDLVQLRSGQRATRSIIFVTHGQGGLVVKEALVTAAIARIYGNGAHRGIGTIYAHTTGLIFLGTVHRAAPGQTLGQTIAEVSRMCPYPVDPAMLSFFEAQSDYFEKIMTDFNLFTRDVQLVCIQEDRPIPSGRMVPEAAASYENRFNLTVDMIRADHFEMARFSRRTDSGYFQVLGHLSRIIQGPSLNDMAEAKEQRCQEILDMLYFEGMSEKEDSIDIDNEYKLPCAEALSATAPGEAESDFNQWLESKDPLFWMSGRAGCGKSTLMKYAFQHDGTQRRLERWARPDGRLMKASVHLFADGTPLQRGHETILRTAIYQMLCQRKDLIPAAFPAFLSGPWPPLTPINSIVNLTQAFWGCFAQEGERLRLVVFIDGLDEYRREREDDATAGASPQDVDVDEKTAALEAEKETGEEGDEHQQQQKQQQQQQQSTNSNSSSDEENQQQEPTPADRAWVESGHREIARLVKSMGDQDRVKFCVSSRPLPVFGEAFAGVPRLHVHHQSDRAILRYCAARLEAEVPNLADARLLCERLAAESRGDIVWARLAMDVLLSKRLTELRAALADLPGRVGGVRGLYMYMFQGLRPEQRRAAGGIFRVMGAALRGSTLAPSVLHLAFAAEGYADEDGVLRALQDGGDDGDGFLSQAQLRRLGEGMAGRIETCCQGLLKIEGGGPLEPGQRVTFSLPSAKDFALRRDVCEKLLGGDGRDDDDDGSPGLDSLDIEMALLSSHVRLVQCFRPGVLRPLMQTTSYDRPHVSPEAWLLIAMALRCAGRVEGGLQDRVRCRGGVDDGDDKWRRRRDMYVALLDRLDASCQKLWVEALRRHQPVLVFSGGGGGSEDWDARLPALCRQHWAGFEPMERGRSPRRHGFLALAVQANLALYVAARFERCWQPARDGVHGGGGVGRSDQQGEEEMLLRVAVVPSPSPDAVPACRALAEDYGALHVDFPATTMVELVLRQLRRRQRGQELGISGGCSSGSVNDDDDDDDEDDGGSSDDSKKEDKAAIQPVDFLRTPAGSKIWAALLRTRRHYFASRRRPQTSRTAMARLLASADGTTAGRRRRNQERWAAAARALLAAGADPRMRVAVVVGEEEEACAGGGGETCGTSSAVGVDTCALRNEFNEGKDHQVPTSHWAVEGGTLHESVEISIC
ncbi:hypothetical protein PG991_003330 [Apiospora marii]|uniref:Nephrocystin 3-like N-terminal domain-containing protein n=1 Tax=Apiospora marii TaxID=335849 RepID=A0ABR1SHZ6_9PEZI